MGRGSTPTRFSIQPCPKDFRQSIPLMPGCHPINGEETSPSPFATPAGTAPGPGSGREARGAGGGAAAGARRVDDTNRGARPRPRPGPRPHRPGHPHRVPAAGQGPMGLTKDHIADLGCASGNPLWCQSPVCHNISQNISMRFMSIPSGMRGIQFWGSLRLLGPCSQPTSTVGGHCPDARCSGCWQRCCSSPAA